MNKEQKVQNLHVSQHSSNEMLSAAFSVNDGNKLIAEFMGAEIIEPVGQTIRDIRFKNPIDGLYLFNSQMVKYNSSWDWLMPAVNKFINQTYLPVESRDNYIYQSYRSELHNLVTDFELTPVLNCLVNAIKWYKSAV